MLNSVHKNVIVTGGAGFIGSHLTDRLLKEDYCVRVIDNFSNGDSKNLTQHNNNHLLSVHKADVCSFAQINGYFKDADAVFHLAALADIVPSIITPLSYYQSNVTGTANVVEAARLGGVKKLVYAASSSCYGIPDSCPTAETAQIRPQYPYALSKYLGEQIVLHWGQVYKLPVVSLRLFNVYGPRTRTSGTYGAVFGVFLAQKINNMPFTVVGDGRQTRDFTFVSDVVDAMLRAAESDCCGQVMNVGSGNTYSINQLVEYLGGEKVYVPKRPGEPDCTHADISKIKRILGWEPKVTFKEGVRVMMEQIDYWKNAPLWTPEKIGAATKDWFKYLGK